MLYYKEKNGRRIFSACSGLTASERIAAGWRELSTSLPNYPRTEPTYFEIVDAVKRILHNVEELTDEEALEVAALYPTWASKIGEEVQAGERLWYNEKLYKVIQMHTVQEDWTPDVTASLYIEVSIVEWPAWKQPLGSEDAYNMGDKVSHNDKHWVSNIDANVWEPGVAGWTDNSD